MTTKKFFMRLYNLFLHSGLLSALNPKTSRWTPDLKTLLAWEKIVFWNGELVLHLDSSACGQNLLSPVNNECVFAASHSLLTYLCVSDLPGRRPLHPQRSHEAAPQPVPGELLRGVLQATGDRVWGGAGGGERRRGLAWPPCAPESSPCSYVSPALTSIPSLCPKHNTWHTVVHDMQLSLLLFAQFGFAFGLPRVRMPNLRLPFFQQIDDLILHPSSPASSDPTSRVQIPKVRPSLRRADTDWRPDATFFLEYTERFNRKRSPSQRDGPAPQKSSWEKASALTQTLKLWGRGTPYSTLLLGLYINENQDAWWKNTGCSWRASGNVRKTGNVTIFKVVKNFNVGLWLCLLFLQYVK